ncbi:MAG: ATP-binding cassette domain-containing protein [Pseudomonadota bacterium]
MPEALSVSGLAVPGQGASPLVSIDDLRLEAGQSLGVRGASGAGKSTLLFALAGLFDTAVGKVVWHGTDLMSLTPDQRGAFRAAEIGFVFQDFLLFEELSGFENAALPALFTPAQERAGLRQRARDLLHRLEVRHPQRPVDSYSGGERQRVGIARELANDAKILLADEPTANLPREMADQVCATLVETIRPQGRTLIVASHDPGLLARMDRVVTLLDGRLVAENPTT